MDYIYNDIEKPLKKYKNYIWYDEFAGINRLHRLAKVLGLKELILCGEKDDEDDIAAIRTNPEGDGLILDNCHLKLVLLDNVSCFSVKNKEGEKTYFNGGEENVI